MNSICSVSVLHQNDSVCWSSNARLRKSSHVHHSNMDRKEKLCTWHRACTERQPLILCVREYLAGVWCHLGAGGMPAMLYLFQQRESFQLLQQKKDLIMENHFHETGEQHDKKKRRKAKQVLASKTTSFHAFIYDYVSEAEMNLREELNVT